MADAPYRTAIVTGASRGIGAATVRRLSELGLAMHAVDQSYGGSQFHRRGES